MARALMQLSGGVAAVFVFTWCATAEVMDEDSFETSSFSPLWNQTNHARIGDTGGAMGTHNFASIGEGGELGGRLAPVDVPADGLTDFAIDFYFRVQGTSRQQFNLQLATARNTGDSPALPPVNIGYEPRQGWWVKAASGAGFYRRPLPGLGKIRPDVWHRFRFTGRDWGQAGARYDLQLADADAGHSQTTVTNLAFFQDRNSSPKTAPARSFVFSAATGGNPGFDVDEVRVVAIKPYKGAIVRGVDTQTLFHKVMCGYQGWFGVPGDGSSGRGWRHWTKRRGELEDGNAKVDLWPDVSDLSPADRFPTGFRLADGRPAEVFSSFRKTTVLKHFEWMEDYGIDGVFVQRFVNDLRNPSTLKHCNTVLENCRAGANLHGRAYAVMYDLSGLPAGHMDQVIEDWRALRREMVITEDAAYLRHRGKPVVAVWGIGFNDGRKYTLAECRRLIEFLKNDPEVGGCTVMVGVPAHWRELNRDAVNDPMLLEIAGMADVISPWTVGRYVNPAGAVEYADTILKPDEAWCRERGIDYLPVIFPGFSWHNMYGGASDKIPRLSGQFLWSQFCGAKRAGASMIYVAMFDEVDEGTAIFKCANDVPAGGESRFITFEGLPSDYYLKLVGAGARLLRNEIPLDDALPLKINHPGAPMQKSGN